MWEHEGNVGSISKNKTGCSQHLVEKSQNLEARHRKKPETEKIKAGNPKALSKSGHWTYDLQGIKPATTRRAK
jgi:hypothetical protein